MEEQIINTVIKILALTLISTSLMANPATEVMPESLVCTGKTGDELEDCKTENMVICMKHGLNEMECAGMMTREGNVMIGIEHPSSN